METFSTSLLAELELQLQALDQSKGSTIKNAESAINILLSGLDKLRRFIVKYKFADDNQEIRFFREIKPLIVSQLIYHHEIYRICSALPCGSTKAITKFYDSETRKLKSYYADNAEFYRYYRTDSTYLDKHYFRRGAHDLKLPFDSYYFQSDYRFCTSHDFKVAKLLANEKLNAWLQNQISHIYNECPSPIAPVKEQKWTGSKVALIELLYALHSEGVFNHGKAELKEVAALFESAFNIELGQYHRTFLEIRGRKSERAKFLCSLKEKLLTRMEEADEG